MSLSGHSRPGRASSKSGHVRSALKAEVLCQLLWVDRATRDVFQAPKLEPWIVRYELSDSEWAAIKPFLPNKSRCSLIHGGILAVGAGVPQLTLPAQATLITSKSP